MKSTKPTPRVESRAAFTTPGERQNHLSLGATISAETALAWLLSDDLVLMQAQRALPPGSRLGASWERDRPTGQELWDLARRMISMPLDERTHRSEQGPRIRLARRMRGEPLGEAATRADPETNAPRRTGAPSQLAHEFGTAEAYAEHIHSYATRYGVDARWLITGEHLGFRSPVVDATIWGESDAMNWTSDRVDTGAWTLPRERLAARGIRLISPMWLDPWLIAALHLPGEAVDAPIAAAAADALLDIRDILRSGDEALRRVATALEQERM